MGRQRRLRIGDRWFRVDLLFFHRRLRRLVVIDLKIGGFTHADAGQMHLYLNYARAHWDREGENPTVGLVLCSEKDEALARYALEGLPNNVMAAEYRVTLPNEELLAAEIDRTRQVIESRGSITSEPPTMGGTPAVENSKNERCNPRSTRGRSDGRVVSMESIDSFVELAVQQEGLG